MHAETLWLKTLRLPILVVGNGVLAKPIPEDSFATVIRFNNYQLGGWSGNKVSHWVTSGYKTIENKFPLALIPWSKEHQTRPARWDLLFEDRVGVTAFHLSSNTHITRHFPFALSAWTYFPSTGFCFLAWLNQHKIRPSIVGFDGMKSGHQSNPNHVHRHRATREQEWHHIQTFVEEII